MNNNPYQSLSRNRFAPMARKGSEDMSGSGHLQHAQLPQGQGQPGQGGPHMGQHIHTGMGMQGQGSPVMGGPPGPGHTPQGPGHTPNPQHTPGPNPGPSPNPGPNPQGLGQAGLGQPGLGPGGPGLGQPGQGGPGQGPPGQGPGQQGQGQGPGLGPGLGQPGQPGQPGLGPGGPSGPSGPSGPAFAAAQAAKMQALNRMGKPVQPAQGFRKQIVGTAIVRLLQYCEILGTTNEAILTDINFWKKFVGDFFSENGLMRYSVSNGKETKQFEVPLQIIPRYYHTFFMSNTKRIQIVLENPREFLTSQSGHFVQCTRASVIYTFKDGVSVVSTGSMRTLLNRFLRIEWLDFHTLEHQELVLRQNIPQMIQWDRDNNQNQDGSPNYSLKPSNVTSFGVASSVMRCLEISETMSHMRDLMMFSLQTNVTGPLHALETFSKVLQNRDQGQNPNPQGLGQGQGQPGLGQGQPGLGQPGQPGLGPQMMGQMGQGQGMGQGMGQGQGMGPGQGQGQGPPQGKGYDFEKSPRSKRRRQSKDEK